MTLTAKPRISVVIPCYNNPFALLCEAIGSVSAQTLQPHEILLIDDGSADPAQAQAAARRFPEVRLIRHPQNRGGSAARNSGITAATGELIAFLDADDLWLPQKLAAQVDSLRGRDAPVADTPPTGQSLFSASNCYLETPDHRAPANVSPPAPGMPLWHYFLERHCALQTSTLLVPAALAKTVLFQEGLPRHQDWDFVLRLEAAGGQLDYLHDCLSVYRLRHDPGRVTRHPMATRNSLVWLGQMAGTIPPAVLQRYFFERILRRSDLSAPLASLSAIRKAIMLSPRGTPAVLATLLNRYRHRRNAKVSRDASPRSAFDKAG